MFGNMFETLSRVGFRRGLRATEGRTALPEADADLSCTGDSEEEKHGYVPSVRCDRAHGRC